MAAAKKGLYANIQAKRDRIAHGSGEKMRKPGAKGAPAPDAFEKAENPSTASKKTARKTAANKATKKAATKKAAAKAPAKKAPAKKTAAKKTTAKKSSR